MNCTWNKNDRDEMLLGYFAGTLRPDAAKSFAQHIEICSSCKSEVHLQKMLDETLDSWDTPPVSAGFDAALMARIRSEATPASWWQSIFASLFPSHAAWKTALPLALAALALAVFLTRPADRSSVASGETLKADEIAEVERTLDDIEAIQALHQAEPSLDGKEAL